MIATTAVNNTSSNAEAIANALMPIVEESIRDHGELITILALIGAFSIIGSISRVMMPVLELLGMLFVITPILIFQSLTTKEKRGTLRKELGEIKEYTRKNPKVAIGFILFIMGVILFCITVVYVSIRFEI